MCATKEARDETHSLAYGACRHSRWVCFRLLPPLLSGRLALEVAMAPACSLIHRLKAQKVMAVWTELQPLPLMKRAPFVEFSGFTLLILGNSFLFATTRDSWPERY